MFIFLLSNRVSLLGIINLVDFHQVFTVVLRKTVAHTGRKLYCRAAILEDGL